MNKSALQSYLQGIIEGKKDITRGADTIMSTHLVPTTTERAPSSGFDEKIRYITFRKISTDSEGARTREFLGFIFATIGAIPAPKSTSANWATYIASYNCLAFPQILEGQKREDAARNFAPEDLTDSEYASLRSLRLTLEQVRDKVDHRVAEADNDIGRVTTDDILQLYSDLERADLRRYGDEVTATFKYHGIPVQELKANLCDYLLGYSATELYGHLSLVAFLAGKQITFGENSNKTQISVARPKAIESKYFDGKLRVTLSGRLQLNERSIKELNRAWGLHATLRCALISEYIKFTSKDASTYQDVFYTTFRLLAFSNIAAFQVIQVFLNQHPVVMILPAVQADLRVWQRSCSALLTLPPSTRPYYKLMMADKANLFRRGDLPTLFGLAVEVLGRDTPTLLNIAHTIPEHVITEFDRYVSVVTPSLGDILETGEGEEGEPEADVTAV